ncbi:MAG: hypothetical protein ABI175_24945, partial [Polyangiales bacterium]
MTMRRSTATAAGTLLLFTAAAALFAPSASGDPPLIPGIPGLPTIPTAMPTGIPTNLPGGVPTGTGATSSFVLPACPPSLAD